MRKDTDIFLEKINTDPYHLSFQIFSVSCLLIHLGYLILFFFLKLNLLLFFNIGSVLLYSLILYLVNEKRYKLSFFLAYLEIAAHSFLAVLCLGWNSNFGFFFIAAAMFIILMEIVKTWMLFASTLVMLSLGLLSFLLSEIRQPLFIIKESILHGLGIFNLTVCFVISVFFIYYNNNRYAMQSIRLKEMADKDWLTGVYNRRFFNEYIEIERRRMMNQILYNTDEKADFSIAMVDIDNFKNINDIYGHPVGDYVLREMVHLMEESIFTRDILYRYGGDEFVILFTSSPREGALAAVERIRSKIEKHPFFLSYNKPDGHITVSIGFASFEEENDIFLLLNIADTRLYHAKAEGKNCVIWN